MAFDDNIVNKGVFSANKIRLFDETIDALLHPSYSSTHQITFELFSASINSLLFFMIYLYILFSK